MYGHLEGMIVDILVALSSFATAVQDVTVAQSVLLHTVMLNSRPGMVSWNQSVLAIIEF